MWLLREICWCFLKKFYFQNIYFLQKSEAYTTVSNQSLTFFIQYIDALSSEFLRLENEQVFHIQTLLVILYIS